MTSILLQVVGAAVVASGCVSAVTPRLADVAPPGQVSADVSLQVAGYAAGEATTGDGRTHDGNAAFAAQTPAHAVVLASPFLESGLNLRYGLGAGCEAGGMLAALRLAGEGRCQLLDQDDGASLSLSVAAAVGYTPFYGRGGVWTRAGVDLSRRLGRRKAKALLLDVYGSYGREAYSVALDVEPANEDGVTPHAALARPEARVSVALGYAWRVRDDVGKVGDELGVIALVPYRAIWQGAAEDLRCENCDTATAIGVTAEMGVALIVSLHHLPGLGDEPVRPRRRRKSH